MKRKLTLMYSGDIHVFDDIGNLDPFGNQF